jgi:hypothetical protein
MKPLVGAVEAGAAVEAFPVDAGAFGGAVFGTVLAGC